MMNRPAAVFERLGTLADPTRTRILLILEGSELTVSELCSVLQLPQSTASRHLKILSDEAWITARDSGSSRFYSLMPSRLDAVARRLWQVVREQFSASPAAHQDARRKESVLGARRVKMHTFFTGAVGSWDQMRTELIGARTDLLALLDLLDPALTVGDLGCGTGNLSEVLAPVVRRVVAIDESGAMLTAARKRLSPFTNIDVRGGSLEALPVDDGELDVALMFMVTHFVLEPAKVLSEVKRALAPGGRILILDLTSHEREEYSAQMGHIWQGFTEAQLRSWVADAGLNVVRFRELPADPKAKGPALFSLVVQKGKR
ncbi:MAG TPA: metalloregulator ArsR/SmtB family transcription factor [Gemmatimonadaceae bacterium]|nr:metalloregulator ArsR/SmtB family transcription factor [Gemmatimonadaceae bacterium]